MENKSIPQSHSHLGFFGIINESFKTTNRKLKQLLYPMLLLMFLSFSQLEVSMLAPFAKALKSQLAKHPNMFQYFTINYSDHMTKGRESLIVQLLIIAISSIISQAVLITTVSSSSEAYTAKRLVLKDMFLNPKKSWKRPLITTFYSLLPTLGIVFVYLILMVITSILPLNSSARLLFGAITTLSIPICYFYATALGIVSMVVSVLEEGCGGLEAIWRASELMKGKRVHASLIMVLFAVAYNGVHQMANAFQSYNLSMGITDPFRNVLFCWLRVFTFVVYTVFYHELKKRHVEKEGKGSYLPIKYYCFKFIIYIGNSLSSWFTINLVPFI